MPVGELTGMTLFQIERTSPEIFERQRAVLREAMSQLGSPISTVFSGQIG